MKGCKENVETNVTVTKNIRTCYFSLACRNRNSGGLWEQQQWNSNRFLLKFHFFKLWVPTTPKQDGKIPANYSKGSGTIVSGTTANKATEAALAAYPGGIVDRVVKLSNGEYEVHNIGVNWPHHVFVNQDFKVVGAD